MDWKVGHCAVGLRDGGSEWHIGTRNRRECNHDSCRHAEKERTEIESLRAVLKGTHVFRDIDPEAECPLCHFPAWTHDPATAFLYNQRVVSS